MYRDYKISKKIVRDKIIINYPTKYIKVMVVLQYVFENWGFFFNTYVRQFVQVFFESRKITLSSRYRRRLKSGTDTRHGWHYNVFFVILGLRYLGRKFRGFKHGGVKENPIVNPEIVKYIWIKNLKKNNKNLTILYNVQLKRNMFDVKNLHRDR